MSSQAWFITGANRGIGLELAKLAASNGHEVFATSRNPSKSTELNALAASNPKVHVVKLESTSAADAAAAAKFVEQTTGGLDVVVANAGIASNFEKSESLDIAALEEHLRVNTIGPVIIFQALYPLLLKRQTRKFVPVSTAGGSIGVMFPPPLTAYGSSKAALNYITKSIHKEHSEEGLIAFPIHPGMVDTDMGKGAAALFGMETMPMSALQSAEAVYNVVDTATAEQGGKFLSYDGTEIPW